MCRTKNAGPSNNTPTSAFVFAEAIKEADLPAGLVSIMAMSHEVAQVMSTRREVGMITLTGGLNAGRKVLEYAKVNIAKPSLELGGKTPVIVEPDADLDVVTKSMLAAKTAHCGQVCTSVERLYVHASVHGTLLAKLKDAFERRHYGDRADDPTRMGPLANAAARLRVHHMVERAKADGAVVETGGFLPPGDGYFYPPTLLSDCRQDMEIVQAIIVMAHTLHLQVVTEGVETLEQYRFLERLGCDYIQGYLLSCPVPLAELRPILDQVNQRISPLRLVRGTAESM